MSRRKALAALAGLAAGSPLVGSGCGAHGSAAAEGSPAGARTRRDGDRVRFRAGDVRQCSALDLRLHGAWRRLGIHAAPQSAGVRLGRSRAWKRQSIRRGGSLVRDRRHEDAVPHHGGADGDAGAAASGWRNRHAPRGHRGIEHADDPEPQHQHRHRQDRGRRERTARGGSSIRRRSWTRPERSSTRRRRPVAVPSSSPSISRPRTTNGPRRIATLAARARRAAARGGAGRAIGSARRPVRRGIACSRDGSGTRGGTSTRFGGC